MKKITIVIVCLILSNITFGNVIDSTIKKDTIYLPIDSLNDHWLYYEIKEEGILYPEIVFAQALLESGHFKSRIFLENKNLFGMRLPTKRRTTAIGKNRGYAVYTNWINSVTDYKLWQDNIPSYAKVSKQNYYSYIQKIYSECGNYNSKVKKIIKRYQKHFNQY